MGFEDSPAVKKVGVQVLKVHQWLYERTNGRIGHRLLGVPCLLLDTVGAKTALRRVNSLTYVRDGADYVVVANNGGRYTGYQKLTDRPIPIVVLAPR